ncbi:response regulator [Pedobacter agri]|uniref:response regulator n=1 Tax=Pedobacter agri TaxID=454586 RepID=UPI00120F4F76|nr:response regulator transcription factor [Pedobacter agri]MDQ1141158.1 NarL family two-component system response regulator LiaR [Pedobacter agri]RZJ81388.1 MAG: response regulator transcription factor [Flavobacterium sp.]
MITISILEDHAQYRNLLVKAIENNDMFTIKGVYSTAEEALLKMHQDRPDVALIDIKLTSQSGIEFINQAKPNLSLTQFLMCTSYQNDENVFNALKAGASGYILKGSSVEEIHSAITELYDGGAPMSPYIAKRVIGLLNGKQSNPNSFGLSERELEVLSLLSKGMLYKEISDQLSISPNTVKNHCKNIYKRLHVQNKVEALNKFNQYRVNSSLPRFS